MGTRADFYVGRGENAEWLGSIACDGFPDDVVPDFGPVGDEAAYRAAVSAFLSGRRDATLPDDGWPWPWKNSHLTDYSYAWDEGRLWASPFGYFWFDASEPEPEGTCEEKKTMFPDMTARMNVALPGSGRSGLIVAVVPKQEGK